MASAADSSLHAHSPLLLRQAIQSILEERASLRSPNSSSFVSIVSHPPSPTSADFPSHTTEAEDVRSLNLIAPLDLGSLTRVPLSTPPRRGGKEASGKASAVKVPVRVSLVREIKGEEDYPLVLVTGGSGFIGSHTVLEILQEGKYGVVVLDNLGNSHLEVLHRVRILAAQYHTAQGLATHLHPPLYFHPCDIQDRVGIAKVFDSYVAPDSNTMMKRSRVVSAIHFAALKSVSGSLSNPLSYYQTNVSGTLNLIEILSIWNCKKLVFSSSCVVYGSSCDGEGIVETDCDIGAGGGGMGITNPYGRTKRMCEEILGDLAASDPEWNTMSLRYTNPSGAHPSGWIGEDPTNAANLMPIVTHVLQGKRDQIYGADYDTPDGTGIRDFIHVVDLAKAHLAAIRAMNIEGKLKSNNSTYNLGTNQGTSVLTVIETLSLIAQRSIKIVICPRRAGDLGCVVCSAAKAEEELGWKAEKGIVEMCRDLVNWQAMNPDGYLTPASDAQITVTKPQ